MTSRIGNGVIWIGGRILMLGLILSVPYSAYIAWHSQSIPVAILAVIFGGMVVGLFLEEA